MGNEVVLSFPFRLSNQGCIAKTQAYTQQHIEDNLTQLLVTRKGERVMEPDYGTNIDKALFDTVEDKSLINIILHELCDDIVNFEPRVQISPEDIEYSMKGSILTLTLNYTMVSNSENYSFDVQL